jgi:hypothetical protein
MFQMRRVQMMLITPKKAWLLISLFVITSQLQAKKEHNGQLSVAPSLRPSHVQDPQHFTRTTQQRYKDGKRFLDSNKEQAFTTPKLPSAAALKEQIKTDKFVQELATKTDIIAMIANKSLMRRDITLAVKDAIEISYSHFHARKNARLTYLEKQYLLAQTDAIVATLLRIRPAHTPLH